MKYALNSFIILLIIGCSFPVMLVNGDMNITVNWTVDMYRDGNGTLVRPLSGTEITAEFSEQNLSGIIGCNRYSTRYTSGSGGMIIESPATTGKICKAEIMAEEIAYIQDLNDVALVQRDDTSLLLMDEDEEILIVYLPI